jgi:hypothetical protein
MIPKQLMDPHEFAAQQFDHMSRDYPGKAWLQNDLEERARLLRAARCNQDGVSNGEQGDVNMGRVTETEGLSSGSTRIGGISGGPEIGRIPLPDYIRMVHPGCILVSRRSLLWMLFSLFVAGLCCGMVLGKLLA